MALRWLCRLCLSSLLLLPAAALSLDLKLDFAIVIDISGSMSGELQSVKDTVEDLLTGLRNAMAGQDNDKCRVGIMLFSNSYGNGQSAGVEVKDFEECTSAGANALKSWLNPKSTTGGENMSDAMWQLRDHASLSWRSTCDVSRVAILIGDEPPWAGGSDGAQPAMYNVVTPSDWTDLSKFNYFGTNFNDFIHRLGGIVLEYMIAENPASGRPKDYYDSMQAIKEIVGDSSYVGNDFWACPYIPYVMKEIDMTAALATRGASVEIVRYNIDLIGLTCNQMAVVQADVTDALATSVYTNFDISFAANFETEVTWTCCSIFGSSSASSLVPCPGSGSASPSCTPLDCFTDPACAGTPACGRRRFLEDWQEKILMEVKLKMKSTLSGDSASTAQTQLNDLKNLAAENVAENLVTEMQTKQVEVVVEATKTVEQQFSSVIVDATMASLRRSCTVTAIAANAQYISNGQVTCVVNSVIDNGVNCAFQSTTPSKTCFGVASCNDGTFTNTVQCDNNWCTATAPPPGATYRICQLGSGLTQVDSTCEYDVTPGYECTGSARCDARSVWHNDIACQFTGCTIGSNPLPLVGGLAVVQYGSDCSGTYMNKNSNCPLVIKPGYYCTGAASCDGQRNFSFTLDCFDGSCTSAANSGALFRVEVDGIPVAEPDCMYPVPNGGLCQLRELDPANYECSGMPTCLDSIIDISSVNCIEKCTIGAWVEGSCSVTCGDGTQTKTRKVTSNVPGHNCRQDTTQSAPCNNGPCFDTSNCKIYTDAFSVCYNYVRIYASFICMDEDFKTNFCPFSCCNVLRG